MTKIEGVGGDGWASNDSEEIIECDICGTDSINFIGLCEKCIDYMDRNNVYITCIKKWYKCNKEICEIYRYHCKICNLIICDIDKGNQIIKYYDNKKIEDNNSGTNRGDYGLYVNNKTEYCKKCDDHFCDKCMTVCEKCGYKICNNCARKWYYCRNICPKCYNLKEGFEERDIENEYVDILGCVMDNLKKKEIKKCRLISYLYLIVANKKCLGKNIQNTNNK